MRLSIAAKIIILSAGLLLVSLFVMTVLAAYNTPDVLQSMLLTGTVLLAFSLVTLFIAVRSWVTNPSKKVITGLRRVEEGNIGKQLKLAIGGEMGEIAGHLDKTMDNLKHLIMIIQNEAEAAEDIGNELNSNMYQTAEAISEIDASVHFVKDQINTQSNSIGITNKSINSITASIDKLSSEIDVQSRSIANSSAAIEEMLANIESVTRISRTNSENVSHLKIASDEGRKSLQTVAADILQVVDESEELLKIIAVLENIASLTNLLSMNAAIEAAHAGEAGKGFAVVAGEVRKLANDSAEQSKTIGVILKKISDSMNKTSNAAKDVLAKFEAIDSCVKSVSNLEEQIRNAMEEQMAGSRQILTTVVKLNEITGNVKESSHTMLRESGEIASQGNSLEKATAEITLGMNEVVNRTDEVYTSIKNVITLSGKNKNNVDSLKESVSHFNVTNKSYNWYDSYLLGDELIDSQHKMLFTAVNDLIDSIEAGIGKDKLKSTLDFMIGYTVNHFNDEEALQRKFNYPGLDRHHEIHENFKVTAVELAKEAITVKNPEVLVNEVKRRLGDWVVNHVTGEDAKIGKYIRDQAKR